MIFSSFRQNARNNKAAETMTFSSFRQNARNDKVAETMTVKISEKKPGMISL